IDSVPEKRVILSVTAPGFTGSGAVNTGFSFVPLIDASERERSQNDIVQMVNSSLGKFNYGKAFALQEQTISVQRGGSNYPIVYILQNINFDKLSKALPRFLEEANNNPILQGVDADLKFNKPELTVSIDREKASRMGISIEEVAQTLQFALSNKRLGYFTKNGKQYQVLGQVLRESREAPLDLKQFYVRTNTGEMVSIDNLVQLEETTSPAQMYHYNRYKSATISAGLAPGYTIGDGLEAMDEIYAKLKDEGLIDDSFTTSLGGSSKDFAESSSNTSFAFILALILIYLVLSAQFESFIDPFIIMLTVPLAIAGALLSLWLFGHTLNIFSEIGMIMLIGLVTKNGILIVEYANRLRDQGATRTKAAIEAAGMRLRPILMTSFAMMFGALPLALSLGAASTSRIPLGIVIVGGILFSLLLSLFIVPVMYTFLSRRKTPASTAILKLDE
ncbi:MAG: efflux RND transporter permease subunit, partial [Chitinophagaceae bacterium]|nr:efflux RND transporter permease subunit [Chitinophagaceae bacterium]